MESSIVSEEECYNLKEWQKMAKKIQESSPALESQEVSEKWSHTVVNVAP